MSTPFPSPPPIPPPRLVITWYVCSAEYFKSALIKDGGTHELLK